MEQKSQSGLEIITYTRRLGQNELAYFLPSRANGNGDILVKFDLYAPQSLFSAKRVSLAWSTLCLRHPMLDARVEMPPGRYTEAKFIYTLPSTIGAHLSNTSSRISFIDDMSADQLMSDFLTSPPVVNPSSLSHLFVVRRHGAASLDSDKETHKGSFTIAVATTHYASDALAIHHLVHELLILLGGPDSLASAPERRREDPRSNEVLKEILIRELVAKSRQRSAESESALGGPAEAYMSKSSSSSKLQGVARAFDYQKSQSRLIGGQVFPRVKSSIRDVGFWDIALDRRQTQTMVSNCRKHRVTTSAALFAVCNIAWIRTQRERRRREGRAHDREDEKQPMLLYTAISVSHLCAGAAKKDHVYPALAYQSLVLPSFLSASISDERLFWHRARIIRKENLKFIKNQLFVGRAIRSYDERAQRAIRFAEEDDAAVPSLQYAAWPQHRLVVQAPSVISTSHVEPSSSSKIPPQALLNELAASGQGDPTSLPKPPSLALMGLSLTGELDRIHHHSKYYGPIKLVSMRGANRQASGGMLLTAPTLNGRMTITLTVDKAGFERQTLDLFWEECKRCVNEWLVAGMVDEDGRERARL